MTQSFSGSGIAIITPFNSQQEIDYPALDHLIEFWISGKVDYLVVIGTTGESVTLDKSEKKELWNFCLEKVAGRIPLVLGVGGNNTREIGKQLEELDATGGAGILSVSPYYNKPTQEGIYRHFAYIAAASPWPVILYNVPGRTGSNVLPETTLRIAREIENITAVKEASGNMEQIMQIIGAKPEGFEVLSGDDAITLPLLAAGADGVISVVANAFPAEFSEMVRLVKSGQLESARILHYKLMRVVQHLFTEGNPGGIKAAMKARKLCGDTLRLPLVNISNSLENKILESVW